MKHYGFLPAKFVILVRPLKEILESWNRVDKIPNTLISRHCDVLMEPGGKVGQAAAALDFLTKHYKENLLIFITLNILRINKEFKQYGYNPIKGAFFYLNKDGFSLNGKVERLYKNRPIKDKGFFIIKRN